MRRQPATRTCAIVALARLLVDVPHVQVDWSLYGPKLAQVALTFGADDVDGVSAVDDMSLGRRRAPLEEIRRNIVAASRSSRSSAMAASGCAAMAPIRDWAPSPISTRAHWSTDWIAGPIASTSATTCRARARRSCITVTSTSG